MNGPTHTSEPARRDDKMSRWINYLQQTWTYDGKGRWTRTYERIPAHTSWRRVAKKSANAKRRRRDRAAAQED